MDAAGALAASGQCASAPDTMDNYRAKWTLTRSHDGPIGLLAGAARIDSRRPINAAEPETENDSGQQQRNAPAFN